MGSKNGISSLKTEGNVMPGQLTESGSPPLIKYDAACRAIAAAKSVDEVKTIRNVSIAMKAYARQAGNRSLEADALEIRMRATRRMDQMRQEQKDTIGLPKGGAPYHATTGVSNTPVVTLAAGGIDKNLAKEGRKLGALSDTQFEAAVGTAREAVSRVVKKAVSGQVAQDRRAMRRKSFENVVADDGAYDYRIGRAQDVLNDIKAYQPRLILCDPPYSEISDPLIDWLFWFAEDVLPIGGSLIMFTGHHRLPRDFAIAANYNLRYWWLLSLRHNETSFLRGKYVIAGHKPVLWFVKEKRYNNEAVYDILTSGGRDKDQHGWGQGDGGIGRLIDALTEPGDLIVEPFCGTGLWGKSRSVKSAGGLALISNTAVPKK